MTRLLLLRCSKRKQCSSLPLPAGDLSTGVFYCIVAKARREQRWPDDLFVGILSANYGFLEEADLILPYEQKMDRSVARLLQSALAVRLDTFLQCHRPTQVMIAMGSVYRLSLASSHELHELHLLDQQGLVLCASGGLGQQLHAVHAWITCDAGIEHECNDEGKKE